MYVCPIAAQKKKETFQSFEIVPSQTMDRVYHNQSALTIFWSKR